MTQWDWGRLQSLLESTSMAAEGFEAWLAENERKDYDSREFRRLWDALSREYSACKTLVLRERRTSV